MGPTCGVDHDGVKAVKALGNWRKMENMGVSEANLCTCLSRALVQTLSTLAPITYTTRAVFHLLQL